VIPEVSRAALLARVFAMAAMLFSARGAEPLNVLFITGGGYHDYTKLAPHLTNELGMRLNARFDVRFGLDILSNPEFAAPYDVIVYDHCDDEVSDDKLNHAFDATSGGKPTVLLHCAVHAFRKSGKIREWERCCGMRSKVHDPFGPFQVTRLDAASPITRRFPAEWATPGDELYQTISIEPDAHPLLQAVSPKDGRTHVVCWTWQYGKGRVFATTLGHDMKTAASREYLDLLANGLLWSADKLRPDGEPQPGYGTPPAALKLK
jgi:uncharacterized protein